MEICSWNQLRQIHPFFKRERRCIGGILVPDEGIKDEDAKIKKNGVQHQRYHQFTYFPFYLEKTWNQGNERSNCTCEKHGQDDDEDRWSWQKDGADGCDERPDEHGTFCGQIKEIGLEDDAYGKSRKGQWNHSFQYGAESSYRG